MVLRQPVRWLCHNNKQTYDAIDGGSRLDFIIANFLTVFRDKMLTFCYYELPKTSLTEYSYIQFIAIW